MTDQSPSVGVNPDAERPATRWQRALRVFVDRRSLVMLLLGFSAGMPFLLVFTTLTAWLATEGVSKSSIGFFTWVGTTYAIKVFWAPVVDRVRLPLLGRWLGQRRSWMLLAQLIIAGGLMIMSTLQPTIDLAMVAYAAVLVAFGSATQDVALDAYRIEVAPDEDQAALASVYVIGYRIALIVAGAGALYLADAFSWAVSYRLMAGLMMVGLVTVVFLAPRTPDRTVEEQLEIDDRAMATPGMRKASSVSELTFFDRFINHMIGAIVAPFMDFFRRYGMTSLVVLLLIATYKISDISMAAMANPLYIELGFSLSEIATVTKVFGVVVTMVGGLVSGVLVIRYGVMPILLAGSILVAATNLLFAWLSTQGYSLPGLIVTITGDNFSNGFAATVFIAYMSSLVSRSYSATQYALFSSLMNLPAKIIGGWSGELAENIGFFDFFLIVGAMGLPAIVLVIYLIYSGHAPDKEHKDPEAATSSSATGVEKTPA